jgi:hypothetical protein
MFAAVKLALAGGLLAAAVPVLATSGVPQPQDPDVVADPFYQESTWNFAVLQYASLTGDLVEIPARLLKRVWLLKTPEGRLRMELLFENLDYSSIDIRDFSIIRSSAGQTAIDIPIVRGSIDRMAFPAMK